MHYLLIINTVETSYENAVRKGECLTQAICHDLSDGHVAVENQIIYRLIKYTIGYH